MAKRPWAKPPTALPMGAAQWLPYAKAQDKFHDHHMMQMTNKGQRAQIIIMKTYWESHNNLSQNVHETTELSFLICINIHTIVSQFCKSFIIIKVGVAMDGIASSSFGSEWLIGMG